MSLQLKSPPNSIVLLGLFFGTLGYTTYHKDRNAAGGGILLDVKDDFPSELVDLKDVEDEILWWRLA